MGILYTATVLVLLLSMVPNPGAATWIYLQEGHRKCFIVDIPTNTLVVGKYLASDIVPGKGVPEGVMLRKGEGGIGIQVLITNNAGEAILQKTYDNYTKFAFTSLAKGEYQICLRSNTTRWFGVGHIKMDLEIITGADTFDYEEIAALEQLSELEMFIRRLNDRVKDIRAEQAYFRNREEEFRDMSEDTNSRVMWFSFVQTVILVGSGLWQIRHLKNFFKAKKMV